jgi:hypothetical protein
MPLQHLDQEQGEPDRLVASPVRGNPRDRVEFELERLRLLLRVVLIDDSIVPHHRSAT